MQKVLITGSSGFLGSHIADNLDKNGFKTVLYDVQTSRYKRNNQQEFIGDILDYRSVLKAMEGCEVVYHLAAQADIDSSTVKPAQTMETNILGTQNILEASRKLNVKRLMFSSTVYVCSEMGSFYRVSKQACEKMIEEYQKEFGLNYTILRYGSLYGTRANESNSVSHMLIQALQQKKIVRRGDGEEIREYIHVKDAAKLSVEALNEEYVNKHLIITGTQTLRIKDLLQMIKGIFQNSIEIIYDGEKELHHYEITPYAYRPQVAQKIFPKIYHDLGQGLLDLIYDLEYQFEKKKTQDKISLRKRKREKS
jgi:UDP-glucose 4-epimerase